MRRVRRRACLAAAAAAVVSAACVLALRLAVPRAQIERLRDGYVAVEVRDEGGRRRAACRVVPAQPADWVPLDGISRAAAGAVVVSEDIRFREHGAFDGREVWVALRDALWRGRRVRGASTISQQTVRNVFFDRRRTAGRKVREALAAVHLERHVGKDKILEIYLNVIEYGDGVYGIRRAAAHYFGKSPLDLTAREGAFLAMLLPNPEARVESFERGRLTDPARRRVRTILQKMIGAGYLTLEQYDAARAERFAWETADPARDAP